ncbi:MAG: hypothetical protein EXS16_02715 [Gemmataceae bacterium]|nr:hypothetical protein [Gemmataceae bacterium]
MFRPKSVSLLAVLVLAFPVLADDVKTLTGKTISGTIEKITDSEIVVKTPTAPVSTPLAQVLDIHFRTANAKPTVDKYIEVQLADESLLRCTKIAFTGQDAKIDLTTGASVKVPISALLTILRDAQDDNIRKQWEKLIRDKSRKDRIFTLRQGDLNPIPGTLGTVDDAKQTIKFKVDGAGDIEPQIEKLQGLQFARTDTASEANLCRVYDVDGNMLVVSKLSYDGTTVNLTTPFGHKIALDGKTIARFDFNFGRLTYLSDLEPKSPVAILLGGFNPVRRDVNLDGDPIMLQNKKYDKGLSIYAGADLEYNLGGKYKEFKAVVGADARIAEEGQGKVTVTIYCDREKRQTYIVSVMNPQPISINVKDVTSLRVVVSGSNFTNFSGHATLANAHVSQ